MRKIKVFVVGVRGFPNVQGGIEKHCQEMYPRLLNMGCEMTVIARSPYIPKHQRVSEWKGIKFIYLWSPRSKYLEAPIHVFLGIIIARFHSPDILHIHAVGPAIFTLFAKLLGFKVVITHHGPDYQREKWNKFAKFFLKLGEYIGLKFADRVIVISYFIKKYLEEKYHRYDLELIPNGINIPTLIPPGETLKKYGLEPQKYVFTACRFVLEKGLHDLIDAYNKIDISPPPFKLVIAGDADHETPYSKELKNKASQNSNIVLTGIVVGKSIAELFSNAGLYVLPSYYEGLPIALLEAISYGLPVLISDIPQHKEIPVDEFRFFPVKDIDKLKEKMIELFQQGLSEEEKKEQKRTFQKKYNWEKIAEQTFNVYEQALTK